MKGKTSARAADFVASVHEAYGAELHRFLVRRLRSTQDAADLEQEVYLRLLRLEKSSLIRKPIAYIYFIASQVAAQFRMQRERSLVSYDSEILERWDESVAAELSDNADTRKLDAQQQLEQLLAQLPATHRSVLLLRKRDGLSWSQIAKKLGISVHTVKKYLYEARARLQTLKWG